jgi:hypothetical protein
LTQINVGLAVRRDFACTDATGSDRGAGVATYELDRTDRSTGPYPARTRRPVWLAAGVVALAIAAVFVAGAGRSDRSLIEAAVLADIPSLQSWIRSAPDEYSQLVEADLAASRAGLSATARRDQRTLTFRLVGAAKLAHADDALVIRHMRLAVRVAHALAAAAPTLCVRFYEQGPDGEIERALPPRLRTDWIRQQGEIMRVPYSGQQRLATDDEEVKAFTLSSHDAAKRLGLQLDDFVAMILGRGSPADICAANTELNEALLAQGPAVAARVFRSRVSQLRDR